MTFGGAMNVRKAGLAFLLMSCLSTMFAAAQAGDYATKRQQALRLFNEDKHLEALPLFEELASRNPKDPEVLLGLGGVSGEPGRHH